VTEVRALFPPRTRRRPWPPRVPDPRTQVVEDLVINPDTELLRPERSHPASFALCQHHGAQRLPADPTVAARTVRARPDTYAGRGEATGHPPPPERNIAQICAAARGGRHSPLAEQITAAVCAGLW